MARRVGRCRSLRSLVSGLRFAVLSILVNIAVLALTLFTGVGLALVLPSQWISAGAGVFRARRDAPLFALASSRAAPSRFGQVYIAGVIISGVVAVPVLNLLTPLFATAFMTRLYKRLA